MRKRGRCGAAWRSGRLPSSCTGNSLLGMFSNMLSSSSAPRVQPLLQAGPNMAGVYSGHRWRLDFIDGGVLVNCSSLSPNQESYSIDSSPTAPRSSSTPRPRPLNLDSSIPMAPSSVRDPSPSRESSPVDTAAGTSTPDTLKSRRYTPPSSMNEHEAAEERRRYGLHTPAAAHTTYTTHSSRHLCARPVHARHYFSSCLEASHLSRVKSLLEGGRASGAQTMQTDLLKGMFGGDKGAPTPPGIRMHGIFAAPPVSASSFFLSPRFSAAGLMRRALIPTRSRPMDRSGDPHQRAGPSAHPGLSADGSLDPGGSGPYQVHGRTVTGRTTTAISPSLPWNKPATWLH